MENIPNRNRRDGGRHGSEENDISNVLLGVEMMDYRFEMLEKATEIINNLEEEDFNRITIDFDDRYSDTSEITINIELIKNYGLDYN